ncbi:MAG: helix-turn-helix domain-containing protein [Candidatus Ornithomonoglobus sp.]
MTKNEKETLISQFALMINNIPSDEDNKTAYTTASEKGKIELLPIKECVKLIDGLSEGTLRHLIAQNKLPYIRSGAGKNGKILISKTALLEYFGG